MIPKHMVFVRLHAMPFPQELLGRRLGVTEISQLDNVVWVLRRNRFGEHIESLDPVRSEISKVEIRDNANLDLAWVIVGIERQSIFGR
jgi:hypothetical protein